MNAGPQAHEASPAIRGMVFDIQPFSLHDGPGIRTTVFLKGCPLHCPWCHNPESWQASGQIAWTPELCVGCAACSRVCPAGAHRMDPGRHAYDRPRCQACGKCAEVCPSRALEWSGRRLSVAQVMERVLVDREFYGGSGGGMTVSGGEPLAQAEFTAALLDAGRSAGIHTAVDTSGAGRLDDLRRMASRSDLVLFDIKAAPEDYERLTGARYEQVVAGLQVIRSQGLALWLRLPMIPGVNDSRNHFENIAKLADEFRPDRIEMIPYHVLGAGKRTRFGLAPTPMPDQPPAEPGQIKQWAGWFRELGVNVAMPDTGRGRAG